MRKLLAVLLVLFSIDGHTAIGTITDSQNAPPSIQRKTQTLPGAKGTGVESMDTLRTTQGKLAVTFIDDTKVQMTENSKLLIDDFVYDPKNKSAGKLSMKVALGTARYASGAVAHNNPNSVNITTPTATIAVRGTDFTATVDEIGRSTIILLPSCPKGWIDIEKDCKTGKIEVITDEGKVIMDQAFQATRVDSKETKPFKPVILSLSEDQINNMLILSPPKELRESEADRARNKAAGKGVLDVNFLEENHLIDNLAEEAKTMYQDRLSQNLLDNDFLANILDIVNQQLAAQLDFLAKAKSGLLPDYNALTGVKVSLDEPEVTLCREGNGDTQCITTRTGQSATIYQTQGSVEIKNRVNSGGGTTISVTQN